MSEKKEEEEEVTTRGRDCHVQQALQGDRIFFSFFTLFRLKMSQKKNTEQ